MIDARPLPLPAWANPEIQIDTLRRDLGYSAGQRDDEIKAAFAGALDGLDGRDGTLCRTLVPAVVRTDLPTRTSFFLPLPPVIQVIGFEQDGADGWAEVGGPIYDLQGSRFTWSGHLPVATRVVAHHGYTDTTVPANLTFALRLMVRQAIDGHDKHEMAIGNLLRGLKVPA